MLLEMLTIKNVSFKGVKKPFGLSFSDGVSFPKATSRQSWL